MHIYSTLLILFMSNFILSTGLVANDRQAEIIVEARAQLSPALMSMLQNAPFSGNDGLKETKPLQDYAAFLQTAVISGETAIAALANGYSAQSAYGRCVAKFSRSSCKTIDTVGELQCAETLGRTIGCSVQECSPETGNQCLGFGLCTSSLRSAAKCSGITTLAEGICAQTKVAKQSCFDIDMNQALCLRTLGLKGSTQCQTAPNFESFESSVAYMACLKTHKSVTQCSVAEDATIGQGICLLSGKSSINGCMLDRSPGYGICSSIYSSGCQQESTLGYGLASKVSRAVDANSSTEYGICVLNQNSLTACDP